MAATETSQYLGMAASSPGAGEQLQQLPQLCAGSHQLRVDTLPHHYTSYRHPHHYQPAKYSAAGARPPVYSTPQHLATKPNPDPASAAAVTVVAAAPSSPSVSPCHSNYTGQSTDCSVSVSGSDHELISDSLQVVSLDSALAPPPPQPKPRKVPPAVPSKTVHASLV